MILDHLLIVLESHVAVVLGSLLVDEALSSLKGCVDVVVVVVRPSAILDMIGIVVRSIGVHQGARGSSGQGGILGRVRRRSVHVGLTEVETVAGCLRVVVWLVALRMAVSST